MTLLAEGSSFTNLFVLLYLVYVEIQALKKYAVLCIM